MFYYKEETYKINGAAMKVYNTLKHGFLEAVIYNYLCATGYKVGLLFNFGHYDGLEIERKVK